MVFDYSVKVSFSASDNLDWVLFQLEVNFMQDHVEMYFHLKSLVYYLTNKTKGSSRACLLNLNSCGAFSGVTPKLLCATHWAFQLTAMFKPWIIITSWHSEHMRDINSQKVCVGWVEAEVDGSNKHRSLIQETGVRVPVWNYRLTDRFFCMSIISHVTKQVEMWLPTLVMRVS